MNRIQLTVLSLVCAITISACGGGGGGGGARAPAPDTVSGGPGVPDAGSGAGTGDPTGQTGGGGSVPPPPSGPPAFAVSIDAADVRRVSTGNAIDVDTSGVDSETLTLVD